MTCSGVELGAGDWLKWLVGWDGGRWMAGRRVLRRDWEEDERMVRGLGRGRGGMRGMADKGGGWAGDCGFLFFGGTL